MSIEDDKYFERMEAWLKETHPINEPITRCSICGGLASFSFQEFNFCDDCAEMARNSIFMHCNRCGRDSSVPRTREFAAKLCFFFKEPEEIYRRIAEDDIVRFEMNGCPWCVRIQKSESRYQCN